MRCLCLLAVLAAAPASEALPAPQLLRIHRDTATLMWRLPTPAGTHRRVLPPWWRGTPELTGATAWRVVREAPPSPTPPPALLALLPRRDAVAQRWRLVADQRRLADAWATAWRARMPSASLDLPAWQAALDAHAERRRSDYSAAAAVEAERQALLDAASAACAEALIAGANNAPTLAAALLEIEPAGLDETLRLLPARLAERWSGHVRRPSSWMLEWQTATAGTVEIRLQREASWIPALQLDAGPQGLRARRIARVRVPAGEDWGSPAVHLIDADAEAPRTPPPVPRTVLRLTTADAPRQIQRRVEQVALPLSASLSVAGVAKQELAPSAAPAEPEPPLPQIAAAPPPDPFRDPISITELPRVDFGADGGEIYLAMEAGDLTCSDERWQLLPQQQPAAQRHAILRNGAQFLPAGEAVLVDAAARQRRALLPALAPGATIALVLGEDPRIHSGPAQIWPSGGSEQRTVRYGETRHVWNRDVVARRIRVIVSIPISNAAGIGITIDPATTPGHQPAGPGLLAWDLDLPPQSSTPISWGWTLSGARRDRVE